MGVDIKVVSVFALGLPVHELVEIAHTDLVVAGPRVPGNFAVVELLQPLLFLSRNFCWRVVGLCTFTGFLRVDHHGCIRWGAHAVGWHCAGGCIFLFLVLVGNGLRGALAVCRRYRVLRDVLGILKQLIEVDRPRVWWKCGCGRVEEVMAQACKGRDGGSELAFEGVCLGA
jgi:hypothetical protein